MVAQKYSPSDPQSEVLSVEKLLQQQGLRIPDYQRPYKWTGRHVADLFEDLARHADKSAYRLGTVVLHREDAGEDPERDHLNLVDGQQRTLTVLLTVKAMLGHLAVTKDLPWSRDVAEILLKLEPSVTRICGRLTFGSDISKDNLRRNYQQIRMLVSRPDFTTELAIFLLKKCEVVVFTLTDLSEAFQFFDSQNARGLDLNPHDLLKAFHLREFGDEGRTDEGLLTRTIERWEALESAELAHFFEVYWFRIRSWSRGRPARYFGKEDVGLFKGVTLTGERQYPATQLLRVAHFFTDHHGNQYERRIDSMKQPFPFQCDQTILNGRRFFEMTTHYLEMAKRYTGPTAITGAPHPPPGSLWESLDASAREIMDRLNDYPERGRRGDEYVRELFNSLLLFYIDRFGMESISRAVEWIFLWAYRVRIEKQRVQLATVDNHALEHPAPFRILREAIHPRDLLTIQVPTPNGWSGSAPRIKELFDKKLSPTPTP